MKRHAAHRDVVAVRLAAFRERDVERGGGANRVIIKEFVEIAHAVEEQGAGVAFLQRVVLRHDRRVAVGDKIVGSLWGYFQCCSVHYL
jgi:hypothetical protein